METTRRSALRALGGVSIAGLAGCSMLGDDSGNGDDLSNGGPVFHESFEADGLPESVIDDSQPNADVAVTEDITSDGARSLALASIPGTSTSAKVTTAEPFSGERRYAVDLYKVTDDVSDGGCRLRLLDQDSDAELTVLDMDYYGGSCYEEKDENGDTFTTTSFGQPLSNKQWHTLTIDVGADEVAFEIAGQKTTYEPALSWVDRDVAVQVNANVWGGAWGPLEVRYDDLRVDVL